MKRTQFLTPIRDCPELTCGDVVNGWRVTEVLGRGGFGLVFKAVKGKVTGALKIYSVSAENAAEAEDEKWRFQQEIRILKAARGKFAPLLYESGTHKGAPYFVMEHLLPVKPSKMPRTDVGIAKMMLDLTEAVERLHELKFPGAKTAGWVHGDIKPDNIARRDSGQYVLIDFGSAHEMDPEGIGEHRFDAGTRNFKGGRYRVAGTKYYEPPELYFRPCRDVYALGHVLRDCFEEVVPLEWSLIVNKCISWQPRFRYPDVASLRRDILDIRRKKAEIYWNLRVDKIKNQRAVERSLAKAVVRHVDWESILSVDRERSTKELKVFRIDLTRETVTHFIVDEPLVLRGNSVVVISGCGVLEADIRGPESSVVVLRAYATLHNVTAHLPPENELVYVLVGPGSYLNFPQMKTTDYAKFFPNPRRRILRDIDAATSFRFGGPLTFSGSSEAETLSAIRASAIPKAYKKVLTAFFRGEAFSIMPEKRQ